jgi:hypothetical protein
MIGGSGIGYRDPYGAILAKLRRVDSRLTKLGAIEKPRLEPKPGPVISSVSAISPFNSRTIAHLRAEVARLDERAASLDRTLRSVQRIISTLSSIGAEVEREAARLSPLT